MKRFIGLGLAFWPLVLFLVVGCAGLDKAIGSQEHPGILGQVFNAIKDVGGSSPLGLIGSALLGGAHIYRSVRQAGKKKLKKALVKDLRAKILDPEAVSKIADKLDAVIGKDKENAK